MSVDDVERKGATGGKKVKRSQAAEFPNDPKTRAFFHFLHVFGSDPTGGAKHLPRPFPKTMVVKPMTEVATERELKRAEKTIYPLIWKFLHENPPKNPSSQTDLLAQVHRRLGPPGENYREWWKKIGRFQFADQRTPGIVIDGVLQDGDEEEDFARLVVMRVFLTKPKSELIEEFRQALEKLHPGNKHIRPFHDEDSFGKARANKNSLAQKLEVWRLKQAHPELSWPDIAKRRKKYEKYAPFDAVKRKESGDDTQSVHAEAVRLLQRWAGEKPSSQPVKKGRVKNPIS